MRVAVTGERPLPEAGAGWVERLARGLPEHRFTYVAACEVPVRGAAPRGAARRRALAAYEALLRALVEPEGGGSFAEALRALAREGRGAGLPALLRSGSAERVLESVWRGSGAEAAAGEPTLRDALAGVALLERCLRPLSGQPVFGGELGAADLCHAVGGGLGLLPALLARWAYGTPVVVTELRPELRERLAALGASPYRRPVRALVAAFWRLLTEEAYRQAGAITAGSAYAARWQRALGAEPSRMHVLPEGLALADHPPAGPEPPRPVLYCPVPGLAGPARETLLGAYALLRESVPEAELRVAGEPPRRPEMSGEGAEGATLVVMPEDDRPEGAELARAMLSGRPVVATDVGVGRELLGPAGLLVPPGDAEALATACAALLGDEDRRARLGAAGRLRARERWDAAAGVEAFRSLYLEVVAHSGAYPCPVPRAGAPRLFARPVEFWLGAAAGGGA
jgi:hypothetical protein